MNYNDVTYATSEPATVTATIRYDNAVHVAGPNTLGGKVAAGDPFPLVSPLGSGTSTQV